jgi:phosphatidylglycerol---prolipoprotein diacylglyceryl transferase
MIHINIDPVAFSLGPIGVHWYGIMYVVAIAIGLFVAYPYARYKGITQDQFLNIAYLCIPAGLVGARLYFVVQQPLGPYLAEPWRILAFWEGGMAFYGAIFAVVLTVVIMTRRMKLSIWDFLDVTVLFAVIGQLFGRIGNIINGDILGYPTTLPWGFVYDNPNSFAPSNNIAYQPAAVYEALINIILFSIMFGMRKRVKTGTLFFFYIFSYSLSQILVFFIRDNTVVFLGLKQAQLTAIVVILVALIGYIPFRRWQMRKTEFKGS